MLPRFILSLLFIAPLNTFAQWDSDLTIYQLNRIDEGANSAFVSLSESYILSDHPDSLCVPDSCLGEGLHSSQVDYFELKGKFREHFLKGTGISEKDHVFLYNYRFNKEVSFKVKDLKVMARLSPYVSPEFEAINFYDYMIGFEIPSSKKTDFTFGYWSAFVAVAKKSPFIKNELVPIKWTRIDSSLCPDFPLTELDTVYGSLRFDAQVTLHAQWKHYTYYLQLSSSWGGNMRLLVLDTVNQTIVANLRYFEGESASSQAINYLNPENSQELNQFTGQLFKGKAPVVFGFQYHSFGCPSIDFLGDEPGIYIRCDNRH